jgi:putative phosphoesterase
MGMRIALISDIHGNLTAIDAVLNEINQQKIDLIICLGDIATIGPQPRQVIKKLRDLNCACILGNHEAALLNPDHADQYEIAPPLIPALYWCAQLLNNEDLNYLKSCKPLLEVEMERDKSLLCFHGSPRSNTEAILATTSDEDLEKLFINQKATVMAGGHSHLQMARQHNGILIFNPGSVGTPFVSSPAPGMPPRLLPWAEYGIIEQTNSGMKFELHRLAYDIEKFIKLVSNSDIPIKQWWLEQFASQT